MRTGSYAPWWVVAAALALFAVTALTAGSVHAAKPSVTLSFALYNFTDGTHVVDYTAERRAGGSQDLAVHHQCFSGGQLTNEFTNRIYWDDSARKQGSWNIAVEAGNNCAAVVVDLSQPTSAALSASGYTEASNTVSYVVR